ncbi:MAG: glycosyltransferase family 2 protein [Cypionkella sp.]
MRHVLISSIKDEGPFLLEWVAHHLVLGFDQIAIASNDCRDGSDALLAALDGAGYITHVANVLQPGDIPQHAGYERIRQRLELLPEDWLMMLDADEFLNVHCGAGRVADLTARADQEIDIIALSGMGFTDAPEINWRPGAICARFPHRLPLRHKANAAVKSLTRGTARFAGIHNHHMVGYSARPPLVVMRGDGARFELARNLPIYKQLRNLPLREITHRLAQYNHYLIKTWDSFLLRRDRGRGVAVVDGPTTDRHTEAYFSERQISDGTDATILRYGAEVAGLMAAMLEDRLIRSAQSETDARYGDLVARFRHPQRGLFP